MKKKFRNQANWTKTEESSYEMNQVTTCEKTGQFKKNKDGKYISKPSKVEQGQVLPVKDLVNRQLRGNLNEKVMEGIYYSNSTHDDPDMEKIPDMDIVEREKMVDNILDYYGNKREELKAIIDQRAEAIANAKKEAEEAAKKPDPEK